MKRENNMPAGKQENFDDVMYDSLETFEVTPSQELKKRIMKDMFLVNIIRYHLLKIVAGISGATVIIVASIYLVSSPDLPKNKIVKTDNNYNQNPTINNQNTEADFLQQTKNNSDKSVVNTTNQINEPLKNTQGSDINNQTTQVVLNNKTVVTNTNNSFNEDKPVHTNAAIQKNKIAKQQQENNSDQNISITSTANSVNDQIINNTNQAAASSQIGMVKINDDSGVSGKSENINYLISRNSLLPIEQTNYDFSKDTFYNKIGEGIFFKTKFYSIDAYWSGFLHQSNFVAVNPEAQDFTSQRNDASENGVGFQCFGINFNINKKHWLLQAGVSMIKIQDDFKYANLFTNPHQVILMQPNNNPYNYINNGNYFLIDTPGGYWHYTYVSDSTIHIKDSVWQNIIDTNLVDIYDSTLKTVYDTLKNKKLRNTYSYIEIPVMVGYEVSYGNFDIALKGGIITSFLVNTSIASPVSDSTGPVPAGSTPQFKSIFFSGIFSAAVHYKITEHWSIYSEPYYRKCLSDMNVKNTILNQKVNAFGVRVGVRYKF